MNIEETEWALNFLEECPTSYQEAIKIASQPDLKVGLYYNKDAGEWAYSIYPIGNMTFWLDSYRTREEAVKLIRKMGWKLVSENYEGMSAQEKVDKYEKVMNLLYMYREISLDNKGVAKVLDNICNYMRAKGGTEESSEEYEARVNRAFHNLDSSPVYSGQCPICGHETTSNSRYKVACKWGGCNGEVFPV